MFDVIAPSGEFSVETAGCVCPVGQSVRYDNTLVGTTVAFKTNACAVGVVMQELAPTLALIIP